MGWIVPFLDNQATLELFLSSSTERLRSHLIHSVFAVNHSCGTLCYESISSRESIETNHLPPLHR